MKLKDRFVHILNMINRFHIRTVILIEAIVSVQLAIPLWIKACLVIGVILSIFFSALPFSLSISSAERGVNDASSSSSICFQTHCSMGQ